MRNKSSKHLISLSVRQYIILAFVFLGLILSIFPKLDISFSRLFYVIPLDFIHKTHPIVVSIFRLVPIFTFVFGAFCFVYLIYFGYKKKFLSSSAFLLLISLIIGPGLIVNYGLKEHFGRARPRHVLEFGGSKSFTPAGIISDQCNHNCSFSSGHAAMGYYFTIFSYITPPQYKTASFIVGVILGSVIGIGRVIQGGHFLSDVVYSGLIIFLVNHLCFLFWEKIQKKYKEKKKKLRK